MIWRYFVTPAADQAGSQPARRARVHLRAASSASITRSNGAYVFSSGKNMGVFKAVGFPEDVGEYYMLENYEGYSLDVRTAAIRPTPRAGGAARTRLRCSTLPSFTTARFPPTTRTAASSRCSATQCDAADRYRGHHLYYRLPRPQAGPDARARSPTSSRLRSGRTIEKQEPKERERLTYLRNAFASACWSPARSPSWSASPAA